MKKTLRVGVLLGFLLVLWAASSDSEASMWWFFSSKKVSSVVLLEKARAASSADLDLVVEYPFGPDSGAYITIGGCVDSPRIATNVRRLLYAEGAAGVFDATHTKTSMWNCPSSGWMHDGRSVFKHMALPRKISARSLPVTESRRVEIQRHLDALEALESLGLWQLSMTIHEIYQDITLWERGVYDPESLIERLQMKLEVWARMPAQNVRGKSMSPTEWKRRLQQSNFKTK